MSEGKLIIVTFILNYYPLLVDYIKKKRTKGAKRILLLLLLLHLIKKNHNKIIRYFSLM